MSDAIAFDSLPDSKQYKSVDTAGVHRKFALVEVEYVPRTEKKEKKKKTDGSGETEEIGTGKFVGPYIKFVFRSEDPAQEVTVTLFQPATKEEEIKFYSDHYEGGVAVRKKNAQEQIQHEFTQKFYFYEQLAKAQIASPEKFDVFKRSIKGTPDVLFKLMFDKFFELFPLEKLKTKLIDIKLMWNNNDKNKTSFLQLAYPNANNLVFAPYVENRDSMLSVTMYEQRNMKRKYSNTDRAPSTDAPEINMEGAWKPVQDAEGGDAGDDKPLF